MNVLGVVAARGGSKGFPGKNKALFNGEALVVNAVKSLIGASLVEHVLVSTDDADIAELAIGAGARQLLARPAHLSDDHVGILSVLKHELQVWEERDGANIWAVVLSSPTTPLRQSLHVDEAICMLNSRADADCVVSVSQTPHQYSVESQLLLDDRGFVRPLKPNGAYILSRQEKSQSYSRNGPCVLALRTDYLKRCKHLYEGNTLAYHMESIFGIDIDSENDLKMVEAIVSSGLINQVAK